MTVSSQILTRRHVLGYAAASAAAALLAGCKSAEQMLTPLTAVREPAACAGRVAAEPAERLIGRIAFGATGYERERLQSLGMRAMVLEQLSPDRIEEIPAFSWRLNGLGDNLPDDFGLLNEIDDHELMDNLAQDALLRAVYSHRQLYERMVEFWSDHFNVYAFKAKQIPQFVVLSDQHAIRPHALGRFRDLLGAMAQSPALLGYLDNTENRKGRPNENYGRELMELHTIGVRGGYTQGDVRDCARCLTGWTYDSFWRPGAFTFNTGDHDPGVKTVMGHTMATGGQQDVEDLLDLLASHPSTANHIATKLLIRFRGDAHPVHVAHVASTFLTSDGDIRATLMAILLDIGVCDAPPILKRPFDYIASSLRALSADTDCGAAVTAYLGKLGQPFRQWPMPDGYPDRANAWTGAFAARWQFAMEFTAGLLENTSVAWSAKAHGSPARILGQLFGPGAGAATQKILLAQLASHADLRELAALALMSPQFQYR